MTKLRAYRHLASLQVYLILSQEAPRVEAYLPSAKDWQRFDYGLDDTVAVPSLELDLPVRMIYAEVLDELGYAGGSTE